MRLKAFFTRAVAQAAVVCVIFVGLAAATPVRQAAAATCTSTEMVCKLFNGTAHLEPDARFSTSLRMVGHMEMDPLPVLFNGMWRMYFRTQFFTNSSGSVQDCPNAVPGIGMMLSTDGDNWTDYNQDAALPGLSTTLPDGSTGCPANKDAPAVWRFGPDAVVVGSTLYMSYEIRDTLGGPAATNRIAGATSTDGIHFTGEHHLVDPGPNSEIGSPDLIKTSVGWNLIYNAINNTANYVRGFAQGGAAFTDPFTVTTPHALNFQQPVPYPQGSWYDFGPGFGDSVLEDGVYYQVFEGWQGTPTCGKNINTPAVGLASSTNLTTWTVSPVSPAVEIDRTLPSCGHDIPNWDQLPSGEITLLTTADPPDGNRPVRWKIVDGAPATQPASPANQLSPNQYLADNHYIINSSGNYLIMQAADGNLVEYSASGAVLWNAGTNCTCHAHAHAIMQSDGNLVVVSSTGVPIASSGTQGHPEAYLHIQNADSNVVISEGPLDTAPGSPLWGAQTHPSGLIPA